MNDLLTERKLIEMEYLYEGMTLADDIYDHSGRLLLLAKGIVLTQPEITHLKRLNTGSKSLSVSEVTFRQLMEHWIEKGEGSERTQMEEKVCYTRAAENVSGMLEDACKATAISSEQADHVSEEIHDRIRAIEPTLLFQCINAPREIDEYLKKHCLNVALLNGMLGRWLKLCDRDVGQLIQIGLLHDIGKTRLPSELLDLPRKLALCEYEVIKNHTRYSLEMLDRDSRFPESVKNAVLFHHERMNGSGYPYGITGEKIPLFAKITAISDVYDAMVSKRSYKEASTPFAILSSMEKERFSGLDPSLTSVFIEKLPMELVGNAVLLSDGNIATIKAIPPTDMEYPIVELDGDTVKTDSDRYCVRMIYQKNP